VKALVLAGGTGSRLRPITYTCSKQLVPLANKEILFYGLESIAATGITEVGIIVGDSGPDIRAAVGDGSRFGIRPTFIEQDAPRGLAHTVLIARDFLGEEPFVMYLGDNVLLDGITDFVAEFQNKQPNAMVLLNHVDDPRQFGVAEVAGDGSLIRLVEKPQNPPSDLALVGVYLFDPSIHEAVRAIEPSARGELEITDAIQWLIDNKKDVRQHTINSPWIDTGKLQDLLEANRIVLDRIETRNDGTIDDASRLEGRVVISEGAKIINSTVRGPVVIGANCIIEGSYVGPYSSIGDGCEIIDSEIEHSVLMQNARVYGVTRIVDSLMGRDACVMKDESQPSAYRMMVGDTSTVKVP
jgi:glucose-1-phosphate thymidylyltransferase